jgi:hypothetical protein
MAIYKLFPLQDTTLYSYYPTENSGMDAICEIFNKLDPSGKPQVARYLSLYDTDEIKDIIDNTIKGAQYSVSLRNFIATAQGITQNTPIEILPVAQSWIAGTGQHSDSPSTENGACWSTPTYAGTGTWAESGSINGFTFTSSYDPTSTVQGGGNWIYDESGSIYVLYNYVLPTYVSVDQLNSPSQHIFKPADLKDIEADVTPIIDAWYYNAIPNYGFITKLSSSFEFEPNQNVQPELKYYSVDTNTIYPPHLEFQWRDYSTILTGSATSSIVATKDIKISLAENPSTFRPESINRFYLNVNQLYPTRTFQTSSLFTGTHYLPTSSYFAIKDLDTNEYVCNFSTDYTQISADSKGNYFTVYMNGLEPERYYSIVIKTEINGSTILFDDNYYFKVING